MPIYLVYRFDSNPYRINLAGDFKGSFKSYYEAKAFINTAEENEEVSGMNLVAFKVDSNLTDSDSSIALVYYSDNEEID